jgi:hypothetical protein
MRKLKKTLPSIFFTNFDDRVFTRDCGEPCRAEIRVT